MCWTFSLNWFRFHSFIQYVLNMHSIDQSIMHSSYSLVIRTINRNQKLPSFFGKKRTPSWNFLFVWKAFLFDTLDWSWKPKNETERRKKQQKSLARETLAAKMNIKWVRIKKKDERKEERERDIEVTAKCVVIKSIIKSQLSTALCKPGIEWREKETS